MPRVTPPAPRLARVLARLLLALVPLALVACGSTTVVPPAQPATDPSDPWAEGPIPSSSGSSPSAPSTPPPTSARPLTLAEYVARIPKFDAAPSPVRVALPHYQDHAALVYQIPTSQPVAFLTIDDGMVRHPMARELIRQAGVPVTLFLTTNYVAGHQDWFRGLRDAGRVSIEGHTVSHPNLTKVEYGEQRYQLCAATDNLGQWYGTRPTLFRPPFGEWNLDTLQAAWSCGLKAGFHWRETVNEGTVYYQRSDHKIRPGDIILMHFRPAFPDDFIAALTAIKNSGLTPALLEDYVALAPGTPVPTTPPPTTPPATPAADPTDPPAP
jgi:peptidoglycan/xylan/chitin deacetylase (PgdA/CDA1 family)